MRRRTGGRGPGGLAAIHPQPDWVADKILRQERRRRGA